MNLTIFHKSIYGFDSLQWAKYCGSLSGAEKYTFGQRADSPILNTPSSYSISQYRLCKHPNKYSLSRTSWSITRLRSLYTQHVYHVTYSIMLASKPEPLISLAPNAKSLTLLWSFLYISISQRHTDLNINFPSNFNERRGIHNLFFTVVSYRVDIPVLIYKQRGMRQGNAEYYILLSGVKPFETVFTVKLCKTLQILGSWKHRPQTINRTKPG